MLLGQSVYANFMPRPPPSVAVTANNEDYTRANITCVNHKPKTIKLTVLQRTNQGHTPALHRIGLTLCHHADLPSTACPQTNQLNMNGEMCKTNATRALNERAQRRQTHQTDSQTENESRDTPTTVLTDDTWIASCSIDTCCLFETLGAKGL